MANFQRLSRSTNWVIGSIETDTGSEYLFGFDADKEKLLWLERFGSEYTQSDEIWKQAEYFVREANAEDYFRPSVIDVSLVDEDMGMPIDETDDDRVVGHTGLDDVTVDVSDDDIAARGAAFLNGVVDLEDTDA